jgi:hypothetical protein
MRAQQLSTRCNPYFASFRHAFQFWPYLFILISVVGLTYVAYSATR